MSVDLKLPAARRAAPKERKPRAPRPPRPPQKGEALVISTAFTMLAIVCLWLAAQLLVFSHASHNRDQIMLYSEFRTQLAALTAPIGPVVEPGKPVALVTIPKIGVKEVVVEGTSSGDLLAGPGHRRDTVIPGQTGVSLIYGKGATYGAPFRYLNELDAGDKITVVSAQGTKVFRVLGLRRAGDQTFPITNPEAARITLVTAEGDGLTSVIAPNQPIYVDAENAEGFTAPTGRLADVPKSEEVMGQDPTAMPLLALCLALLVAMTLGVIAARQRWSTALVWVVTCPLVLALSWQTTDVVMRLLPNLI